MEEGDKPVEEAIELAQDRMGVEVIVGVVQAFKDKVSNVQQDMLDDNPDIQELYDHIQKINEKYAKEEE